MSEKQQEQLPQSDHDLLICIDIELRELKKGFENHLQHHLQYSLMAWTATIGLVVALILALTKS